MKIYAISDLHFGTAVDKPMGIFGEQWENHQHKIIENWSAVVDNDDLVLIPGDLSWAMTLDEALPDLALIDSLPGYKCFIRGNHDYWLSSPRKVRDAIGDSMELIRYNAKVVRGVGICGVRGWPWPGYAEFDEEKDRKYFNREMERLRLSLQKLSDLQWEQAYAMIHYPPLTHSRLSEFFRMFKDAGVNCVVYGHLHGMDTASIPEGEYDGVRCLCVSADYLGFKPRLIAEINNKQQRA